MQMQMQITDAFSRILNAVSLVKLSESMDIRANILEKQKSVSCLLQVKQTFFLPYPPVPSCITTMNRDVRTAPARII